MIVEGRIVAGRLFWAFWLTAALSACGEDAQVQAGASPVYVCGNGDVEQGEECDDANRVESDGCTSKCKVSKVDIDVTVNTCPSIEGFVVSPSQIPPGYVATAHVQASDQNDDSLAYLWTATSGTFSAEDQPETGYTCDAEGNQLLNIVVDDGRHCTDEMNIPVVCLPPE
jgi:cysteine-rich repeat protein